MPGRITLLLCFALFNGISAAGEPWRWPSRMPVRSPVDSFRPSGNLESQWVKAGDDRLVAPPGDSLHR
ncbi:hypothetical protein O3P69_001678 [Scylla paramamosain]|uniref:Uncharacterized protein n=1 Tax=Scylla paramamosain TaxID=85552 RepID=A0AAW0UYS6_SCYPA